MTDDKLKPVEPEHVSCDLCLKEIPEEVAKTFEGEEYIHHFCGLECMDKWKAEHPPAEDEEN